MSATSKNCSLLFVHGWATDSSVWKYQVKEFSKDYEIVTIDLQGHCEKDIWPEPSLKPAVEKILQLTAHSSQRTDFIGIGWSLGGQALLETAVKNPDLFKSLVLIGTAPKFVADETFPYGQPQGVAKRMLKDIKKDFFKTMKRFYPLNFTKEELAGSDAEWFLGYYCEKRCAAFHHDSIAKSLGALLSFDIRKNLNGIKVPVLIIHGEKDNVCPVDTGKYLAENLPNARLEIFQSAGHAPFLTRYKEFNKAVQR
ncbi:MAG: alpha/beta fold hydrolase, partial [Deltaproteobacteria bacterium]|nr:alpha/beta fold hydrolase [Deltaproteobacteria bacterium]